MTDREWVDVGYVDNEELPSIADWAEVKRLRRAEGRCERCGAFDGPDHRCPHLIAKART